MVEVFKTNIKDLSKAAMLLDQIHQSFTDYQANFDLDDCDNILRVESRQSTVETPLLVKFLDNNGCKAEPLPDVIPDIKYSIFSGIKQK